MDTQSIPGPIDDLPAALQERLAEFLEDYAEHFERGERLSYDRLLAEYPQLKKYVERMIVDIEALCGIHDPKPLRGSDGATDNGGMRRGTRLGDFEIIEEIGRGGMGVVYLAQQQSLHRHVALKVLPFAAVLDPNQIARFHTEAQAAASLHHPNIVPVYSVGCERGVHFYSMQFIDGQSLEAVLQSVQSGQSLDDSFAKTSILSGEQARVASKPRANDTTLLSMRSRNYIRLAVEKMIQTAKALHFAHMRGIIHRDIKPSNLLIDRQGNLWVTDFGLARIQDGLNVTVDGNVVGTARYMSPEQASGHSHLVDHRSDIYSFGVTLYEILTLQHAFDGADRWQVLAAIQRAQPRSPRSINASIPLDLETIIFKCMAPSKEDRYASAADLADDLHRFLEGQPIEARRPSVLDRVGKWALRKKKLVAASVAAMMLLTTGAVLSTAMVIQQRDRAEMFAKNSQVIVDRFGSDFADQLEGIPGTEAVRERILREAAEYYSQLLVHSERDASLQWQAAQAQYRLAVIAQRLGHGESALTTYQHATRRFDEIRSKGTVSIEQSTMMASCYRDLASLQGQLGEHVSAHSSFNKALKLLDRKSSQSQGDAKLICERAKTMSDAGMYYASRGDRERAFRLLEQAIVMLGNKLTDAPPDDVAELILPLSICLNNQAAMMIDSAPEKAQAILEQAMQYRNKHASALEPSLTSRLQLAITQSNLGVVDGKLGKREEAKENLVRAEQILENVLAQYPDYVKAHVELAACQNNLAQLFAGNNEVQSAEKHFGKAEALLMDARKRFPQQPEIPTFLYSVRHNLGLLFEQTGRHEQALEVYERALEGARRLTKPLSTQTSQGPVSAAMIRTKLESQHVETATLCKPFTKELGSETMAANPLPMGLADANDFCIESCEEVVR